MSALRLVAGALAGVALVAGGTWALGPARIQAPGLVVPAQSWELRHAGDGALHWALLDGSQPGGPVARAEGVLLAERGGRLEVALLDGIEAGTQVTAGTPLVTARRPALVARARALEAEADAAERDVDVLALGDRQGPVAAAQAQVEVARAALARARRAEEVARELVASGGAGAWEAELAALEVSVQQANLRAAQAAVGQARYLPRQVELDAAQARVEAAAANAEEAQVRAGDAPLTTPLAGAVRQPGGEVVLAVVSEGVPLVQAALPEVQKGAWSPGTALSFVPTGGEAVAATVVRRSDEAVASAAGPRVWVVAQLESPVPVGATGVLQSLEAVGGW